MSLYHFQDIHGHRDPFSSFTGAGDAFWAEESYSQPVDNFQGFLSSGIQPSVHPLEAYKPYNGAGHLSGYEANDKYESFDQQQSAQDSGPYDYADFLDSDDSMNSWDKPGEQPQQANSSFLDGLVNPWHQSTVVQPEKEDINQWIYTPKIDRFFTDCFDVNWSPGEVMDPAKDSQYTYPITGNNTRTVAESFSPIVENLNAALDPTYTASTADPKPRYALQIPREGDGANDENTAANIDYAAFEAADRQAAETLIDEMDLDVEDPAPKSTPHIHHRRTKSAINQLTPHTGRAQKIRKRRNTTAEKKSTVASAPCTPERKGKSNGTSSSKSPSKTGPAFIYKQVCNVNLRLPEMDMTDEEILTFFPTLLIRHELAARLIRRGWGSSLVTLVQRTNRKEKQTAGYLSTVTRQLGRAGHAVLGANVLGFGKVKGKHQATSSFRVSKFRSDVASGKIPKPTNSQTTLSTKRFLVYEDTRTKTAGRAHVDATLRSFGQGVRHWPKDAGDLTTLIRWATDNNKPYMLSDAPQLLAHAAKCGGVLADLPDEFITESIEHAREASPVAMASAVGTEEEGYQPSLVLRFHSLRRRPRMASRLALTYSQ